MAQKAFPFLLTTFLLSTTPALHSAVVTTTDNASPAADNETSLLEALTNVKDNETITFNIPGAGPHYILTPAAGYPLVEKKGVTINGYSQPGASANTAAPDQPRNTKIQIVLDSRTEVPGERRTVLNYPEDGFGPSESCVLGFVDAPNTAVRGLSFIGVTGAGSDEDPGVYCIALAMDSPDARIQGCWFGLDAGKTSWIPNAEGVVPGVHGAATAVASFAARTGDAAGLIFGTDGDGTGDSGEGNVCMAQRLAVALTAPRVTVAGNWINFYPDGSPLNPETFGQKTSAVENGNGTGMRIGTNGDGISDVEEGNRFGPLVNYDVFVEFYRANGQEIVFAGNYIGMGLDGMPAFDSPGSSLMSVRENSSVRIGTDGNGTGDAAEANHISGIRDPFITLRGLTRVGIRGNEISGSLGTIPYTANLPAAASLENLFADILNDATMTAVTLDPASTPASVSGTFPEQLSGTTPPVIDFYLADAFGLRQDPPNPQGRYWLGSFAADGATDLDPAAGKFKFNTTAWALTAAELGQLTITATYTVDVPVDNKTMKAGVTTNFSETLALPAPGAALGGLTIAPADGGGYVLSWTGGISPFRVLSSTSLNGIWSPVSTVSAQTTTITPNITTTPRQFYRIREGASPR